jgi:hypothetical protein
MFIWGGGGGDGKKKCGCGDPALFGGARYNIEYLRWLMLVHFVVPSRYSGCIIRNLK